MICARCHREHGALPCPPIGPPPAAPPMAAQLTLPSVRPEPPLARALRTAQQRPAVAAIVLGALVFVIALAGVGAVWQPASAVPHTISGTFTITNYADSLGSDGSDASGQLDKLDGLLDGKTYDCSAGLGGGYSDIADGTDVTVLNGSGTVIGTGELAGGVLSANGCEFTFQVSVPGADFYQVEVSHRGQQRYSRADLTARAWKIDLTLG